MRRAGFRRANRILSGFGGNSNARYWRARLAEEEGNPRHGAAFYQKLSDRFRNYYYAEFGRQRLNNLPGPGSGSSNADAPHYARSIRISPLPTTGKIAAANHPTTTCASTGAFALNGGLADLAVRELQAAASQVDGTWAPPEIARVIRMAPLRSRH